MTYQDKIKQIALKIENSEFSFEESSKAVDELNKILADKDISIENKSSAEDLRDKITARGLFSSCKSEGYPESSCKKALDILASIIARRGAVSVNSRLVNDIIQRINNELTINSEFSKKLKKINEFDSTKENEFLQAISETEKLIKNYEKSEYEQLDRDLLTYAHKKLNEFKVEYNKFREKRYSAYIKTVFLKVPKEYDNYKYFLGVFSQAYYNNCVISAVSFNEEEIIFNAYKQSQKDGKSLLIIDLSSYLSLKEDAEKYINEKIFTENNNLDVVIIGVENAFSPVMNVSQNELLIKAGEFINELAKKINGRIIVSNKLNNLLDSPLFQGQVVKVSQIIVGVPQLSLVCQALQNENKENNDIDTEKEFIQNNCYAIGFLGLNKTIENLSNWKITASKINSINKQSFFELLNNLQNTYSLIDSDWKIAGEVKVDQGEREFDFSGFDSEVKQFAENTKLSIYERIGRGLYVIMYKNGTESDFAKLSDEEITERLKTGCYYLCRWFLLKEPIVTVVADLKSDINSNVAGMCCGGGKEIMLNLSTAKNSPYYMFSTVAHEMFHAYQHKTHNGEKFNKWYFDYFGTTPKRSEFYRINSQNYADFYTVDDRYAAYRYQILEADTNIFTADVCDAIEDIRRVN